MAKRKGQPKVDKTHNRTLKIAQHESH